MCPLMHSFHHGQTDSLMSKALTHNEVVNIDKVARHEKRHVRRGTHVAADHAYEFALLFCNKDGYIVVGKHPLKVFPRTSRTLNWSKDLRESLGMVVVPLSIEHTHRIIVLLSGRSKHKFHGKLPFHVCYLITVTFTRSIPTTSRNISVFSYCYTPLLAPYPKPFVRLPIHFTIAATYILPAIRNRLFDMNSVI